MQEGAADEEISGSKVIEDFAHEWTAEQHEKDWTLLVRAQNRMRVKLTL